MPIFPELNKLGSGGHLFYSRMGNKYICVRPYRGHHSSIDDIIERIRVKILTSPPFDFTPLQRMWSGFPGWDYTSYSANYTNYHALTKDLIPCVKQ